MAKKNYFEPVNTQVNFTDMEKNRLDHWYKSGIVDMYLHKNDTSDKYFSFMDGPITANNPMGVHHAWGRTYKDLWQRYKNMQGYRQRFQNGFDCQGLWVEVEVEKELGLKSKKDIENLVPGDKSASIDKFINLCKERVAKFSALQTEQTKRLGNFMDWDHSYFTLSDENNYMIWHFLKVCHERGWIYKGLDSVPWCPRCETAISQHEMLTEDYKEAVHESVFFALPVENEDYELLVWTTTPWTIPANVAVAVHPDWVYKVWKDNDTQRKYVILGLGDWEEEVKPAERVFSLISKSPNFSEVKDLKGSELIGKHYSGPFDDIAAVRKANEDNSQTFHTIIPAKDLVTANEGTGLVHIAPGAGAEDFALGKEFKLPLIAPIDDQANYVEGFDFLSGQNAKKHPEIIIDYLAEKNFLVATHQYKHRYPACWRCKTELVWKVADEWYIAMDKADPTDKQGRTLRQELQDVAKMITWLPSFGLDRELDWLANMHDWLISKPNRYWGLALPIYECRSCKTFEVIGGKDELKQKAVSGWEKFEGHTPHKPWIDEVKIKCPNCGEVVDRLPDVGNVWLDAGIVPFSTIKENNQGQPLYWENKEKWNKWFPLDFITESFPGQFKNWFYSLIAMSTVLEKKNPMKTVLGYGTLLAEDGRAMHKSWGNSIEFNEGADKMGADVMRWMYAKTNPSENMLFGYRLADENRRQFHLKLWNVYNFFVTYANAQNWEPDGIGVTSANILDIWIDARLQETIKIVTDSMEVFDAQSASLSLEKFVEDLSNWYIRRSRSRVNNDFLRTTYTVLTQTALLLAPFNPYISEEIFTNLTKKLSVHLEQWPESSKVSESSKIISDMTFIRLAVEKAHAERKTHQISVRQPLALAEIYGVAQLSEELIEIFKEEVNVKNVVIKGGDEVKITLDVNINEDLRKEGEARELVRQIQEERKKLGTAVDEQIDVTLPLWPSEFESEIKKKALIRNLSNGEFKLTRINGSN